jgi:hypothetical protein
VKIIRFTVTRDPYGVLVALSPDIPGRPAFGRDLPSLEAEIRDTINRHFAKAGDWVLANRKRNDLSTWTVETVEGGVDVLMALASH